MKYSLHRVEKKKEGLEATVSDSGEDQFYHNALEFRLEGKDESPRELFLHILDQLLGFYAELDPSRDFHNPKQEELVAERKLDFDLLPEKKAYKMYCEVTNNQVYPPKIILTPF